MEERMVRKSIISQVLATTATRRDIKKQNVALSRMIMLTT
jgi:hypothetical protein